MYELIALCCLIATTAFCAGAIVGYSKAQREINKLLKDKFGYILGEDGEK